MTLITPHPLRRFYGDRPHLAQATPDPNPYADVNHVHTYPLHNHQAQMEYFLLLHYAKTHPFHILDLFGTEGTITLPQRKGAPLDPSLTFKTSSRGTFQRIVTIHGQFGDIHVILPEDPAEGKE